MLGVTHISHLLMLQTVPGIGNIYVEFLTVEDAAKAVKDLDGRKFGDNVVTATFYSEQL